MKVKIQTLLLLIVTCVYSVKSQVETNNSYIKDDGKKVEVKTPISKMKIETEGNKTVVKSDLFGGVKEDLRIQKKKSLQNDIATIELEIKDKEADIKNKKLSPSEIKLLNYVIEKKHIQKGLKEIELFKVNKLIENEELSISETEHYENVKTSLKKQKQEVDKEIENIKMIEKSTSDYRNMGDGELSVHYNKLNALLLRKKTNLNFNFTKMSLEEKGVLKDQIRRLELNVKEVKKELDNR